MILLDANAAQMRTHGITTIRTYNGRDFARLPGGEALTVEELLARYQMPHPE